MKLLIIGNSHVGSLAKAIRKNHNNLKVDLLAVGGGKLLPNLEIDQQSHLFSNITEIQNLIDKRKLKALADYSVVIIYGCQLQSMRLGRNGFSRIKQSNNDYSSAFKNAVMDEFITNTVHYRFLTKYHTFIRGLKNTRFISIPCPKPNESSPHYNKRELSIQIAQAFDKKVRATWNQLKIEFLDTPKALETSDGLATQAKYKNERPNDFFHLNELGGELVMEEIVSFLKI